MYCVLRVRRCLVDTIQRLQDDTQRCDMLLATGSEHKAGGGKFFMLGKSHFEKRKGRKKEEREREREGGGGGGGTRERWNIAKSTMPPTRDDIISHSQPNSALKNQTQSCFGPYTPFFTVVW